MIKNQGCGWAEFQAGNFTGQVSYITRAPADLLTAAIEFVKTKKPQAVYFDEEGSSFIFVLSEYESYVIAERETSELYVLNQSWTSLIKEILEDIKTETTDRWAESFCLDERDFRNLRGELNNLVRQLETLLGQNHKQQKKKHSKSDTNKNRNGQKTIPDSKATETRP